MNRKKQFDLFGKNRRVFDYDRAFGLSAGSKLYVIRFTRGQHDGSTIRFSCSRPFVQSMRAQAVLEKTPIRLPGSDPPGVDFKDF